MALKTHFQAYVYLFYSFAGEIDDNVLIKI